LPELATANAAAMGKSAVRRRATVSLHSRDAVDTIKYRRARPGPGKLRLGFCIMAGLTL